MRIALLQLNPTVGDIPGNAAKIISGYQEACLMGADLVVGTELMLLGYPPQDLLLNRNYMTAQDEYLRIIAEYVGQTGLLIGAAVQNLWKGKPLFNSAMLLQNGALANHVIKKLLPNYDVFDEKRYFEPADPGFSNIIPYDPRLPEGHQPIPGECLELGVFICEDGWGGTEYGQRLYELDPLKKMVGMPPKVAIFLNASPYYWGKGDVRFELFSGIAKRLDCPVVYANQVGGNDSLIFDGRSFAVDAIGNCIGVAKAFAEDILVVDLDSPARQIYPSDTDNVADLHDALVLGIRDYCRKVGFERAVTALSGGVDSAVTFCLGVAALGAENMLGVGLPSPFSSKESLVDASDLASNLGTEFRHAYIDAAYVTLLHAISGLVGDSIDPSMAGAAGIAAQNVQARVRGNILMGISNVEHRLVLSTGNKSEIAVGYCTLYGDMCGGLGVLADVPKTLVYELARYINRNGVVIPERTITKPPSAELAPDQLDTDSLPPYDDLDPILDLYVGEMKSLEEIVAAGFDPETVRKIIRMVDRNEYKRHQMSPGLKVTNKAFGAGRRIPIAAKHLD